ncbi:MAG: polysaccharide deacetylase family protein [Acidobacteriota bacterium]
MLDRSPFKIRSQAALKAIYLLKGRLKPGLAPPPAIFDGIEIAPFPNDAPAAVCISADFELSWAWRRHPQEISQMRGRQGRCNLPIILEILRVHSVPITWATVGHLFLQSCRCGADGRPHPEMPRPLVNRLWEGDWYRHDPCTDWENHPEWYAPDLIEQIVQDPIPHEIGSHSFSHIDYSADCSSDELVRAEMERCLQVMEEHRLKPRTLIYPFNRMGHHYLGLLSEYSLTSVRHRDPRVMLSYPEPTEQGIYKLYESLHIHSARRYDCCSKAQVFLQEAVRRNALLHLWFHPSDPTPLFRNEFRRIVEHLAQQREQGRVWIATMEQLAAYCEARRSLRVEVQREHRRLRLFLRGNFDRQRYGEADLTLLIPHPTLPRQMFRTEIGQSRMLHPPEPSRRRDGQRLGQVPTATESVELEF